MTEFDEWVKQFPDAAKALLLVQQGAVSPPGEDTGQEAGAQLRIRQQAAARGDALWRNNVGATKARCRSCGAAQQPVRYGLCNDSKSVNEKFKSHDLIGIRRVLITPEHVGTTIGQFVSIEVKRPGWTFTGTDRELAQAAWGTVVQRFGGFATFSTGDYS